MRDTSAGIVLGDTAGSMPELGDSLNTEVKALTDTSKEFEASEVSAPSEAHKVQFDTAR